MAIRGGDIGVSKIQRNLPCWGKAVAKERRLVGKEKSRKQGTYKQREHCEPDNKATDRAYSENNNVV